MTNICDRSGQRGSTKVHHHCNGKRFGPAHYQHCHTGHGHKYTVPRMWRAFPSVFCVTRSQRLTVNVLTCAVAFERTSSTHFDDEATPSLCNEYVILLFFVHQSF